MLRALNFELYSRINLKQALSNIKLTWVLRGKMHALSFRHFSLNKDAEPSYYPVRDNGSQINQKAQINTKVSYVSLLLGNNNVYNSPPHVSTLN